MAEYITKEQFETHNKIEKLKKAIKGYYFGVALNGIATGFCGSISIKAFLVDYPIIGIVAAGLASLNGYYVIRNCQNVRKYGNEISELESKLKDQNEIL